MNVASLQWGRTLILFVSCVKMYHVKVDTHIFVHISISKIYLEQEFC